MLLTRERVQALARINRYTGWTTRPYSVLEHSVIGAKMVPPGVIQRAFLLHDMEESAFGDIISPVKRKYMSPEYHTDVEAWVRDLAAETKVPYSAIDGEQVHHLDRVMLAAETRTVYVQRVEARGWVAEIPVGGEGLTLWAQGMIEHGEYVGDRAITAFWQMWGGC